MISDKQLSELIDEVRRCYDIAGETGSVPGVRLNSLIGNALYELAHYRRAFAKIEEIIREKNDVSVVMSKEGEFTATEWLGDGGYVGRQAKGDTPFAALSALADSIIREELERKEST